MGGKNEDIIISICIPAYKRPQNLKRLLDSIAIQDFSNYEIILSDDSPDKSVVDLLQQYTALNIQYYHNQPSLGTPANWNFAISKANGQWIKIMHDDDWFSNSHSLQQFFALATQGKKIVFSGYENVFEDGRAESKMIPSTWKKKIIKNPLVLLSENVIGPPSVMMIHRSVVIPYDVRMKWRVDIDYYVQVLLQESDFSFTQSSLVKVGISSTQVTHDCINIPEVELPEGYLLLVKYGVGSLKSIRVYDAWWRIFRNLGIRSESMLGKFVQGGTWPEVVKRMIGHQGNIPPFMLSFGILSKLFMALSYMINFNRIK